MIQLLKLSYKNKMERTPVIFKKIVFVTLFAVLCLGTTALAGTSTKSSDAIYNGIDYSPVYSYSYYTKKHPDIKKKYKGNRKKVLRYYVLHGFPKKEKARKNVKSGAFDSISRKRISKALAKTKTSEKTDQIILVSGHQLSLWNRHDDGTWKRKFKAYCGYGQNGLSADRHEGDRTTPIGSFPILHAFGTGANPGTSMTWKRITNNSYWSSEQATYNTWVESRRWISGEHLIDYYQYEYAMAIGFNRNPTVYKKGSAIFLHCKSYSHWYTAGCISVRKSVMKKLLKNCHNGVYIIIVPNENKIKKY